MMRQHNSGQAGTSCGGQQENDPVPLWEQITVNDSVSFAHRRKKKKAVRYWLASPPERTTLPCPASRLPLVDMVFAWLQRILPSWLVYGGQTASTPPATSKDSDALPDDVMTSPSWAWDLKGSQRAYDPATAQRLELAFAAGEDIVDLDQGFFASRPGQYRVLLKAGRQLNTVTQFTRVVFRNNVPLHGQNPGTSASATTKTTKPNNAAKANPEHLSGGAQDDLSSQAPPAKRAKPSGPLQGRAEDLKRLASVLLSAACATQPPPPPPAHKKNKKKMKGATTGGEGTGDAPSVTGKHLKFEEVIKVMRDNVPKVDGMLDRLGQVPVSKYIAHSYENGLPSLQGDDFVLRHSRDATRFIFGIVPSLAPKAARSVLTTLAEAFQSCQAEQARVIDELFGMLSGRDKGLREQVLALVDSLKQRALDLTSNDMYDVAVADSAPQSQLPHIQSRLRVAIGEELGLRGVAAGRLDINKPPPLSAAKRKQALAAFRSHFDPIEVVEAFVADVNQQDEEAERYVFRDTLSKWAGEAAGDQPVGFDAHRIYWDEDRASDYDGKPCEANLYQPYLSVEVGLDVLLHTFVTPPQP